jgi:hypothetical protein
MCTVGYGDISATNTFEMWLSTFNILMACMVFAHAVKKKIIKNKIYYNFF